METGSRVPGAKGEACVERAYGMCLQACPDFVISIEQHKFVLSQTYITVLFLNHADRKSVV